MVHGGVQPATPNPHVAWALAPGPPGTSPPSPAGTLPVQIFLFLGKVDLHGLPECVKWSLFPPSDFLHH